MRRGVRARHAEQQDQGAGAVQHVAEHVPRRAVRSGGRLREREPRSRARDESDVGSVLEVRRRRYAAREHLGHEHHRHAVDRRADRVSPFRSRSRGRRWGWRCGRRRWRTRRRRWRLDGAAAAAPAAPPPAPTVPLPTGMYIMGPIFQDEKNLLVAHAFQQATDFHKKRPPHLCAPSDGEHSRYDSTRGTRCTARLQNLYRVGEHFARICVSNGSTAGTKPPPSRSGSRLCGPVAPPLAGQPPIDVSLLQLRNRIS